MSPLVGRVVARFGLAAGASALALAALAGDGAGADAIEVVIDLRPVAASVRAVRVDLADGERPLGGVERRFDSGSSVRPIRIRTSAPAEQVEIAIELETSSGPRRVRRTTAAASGSTVTISVDGLDPVAAR